jgi:hypothetical protein
MRFFVVAFVVVEVVALAAAVFMGRQYLLAQNTKMPVVTKMADHGSWVELTLIILSGIAIAYWLGTNLSDALGQATFQGVMSSWWGRLFNLGGASFIGIIVPSALLTVNVFLSRQHLVDTLYDSISIYALLVILLLIFFVVLLHAGQMFYSNWSYAGFVGGWYYLVADILVASVLPALLWYSTFAERVSLRMYFAIAYPFFFAGIIVLLLAVDLANASFMF